MNWKITLTTPDIGPEEIAAVTKVLESKWLTMGPATEAFENAFAAKMSVRHAIAVASGTAALHLANVALEVSAGNEVVCPALSFVATANASRYAGAEVIFANVLSTTI
jgi:dTDP-4-amino-4,6-dideoxygalactose transaminase